NIVIDFNRFGLRTRAAEEMTTLGTGVASADGSVELSTLTVEIDIAAAASAPILRARALQSPPAPLGWVKHVRVFNYNPSAGGEFEISDLPKGHLFNQVHFASGDVDALRIERDRFVVFERNAAENILALSDGVRVPQSDYFHFDGTEDGNGGEMFETRGVSDLRFVLNMSAAGSVPVIVESVAPLI
ncbi:MAG: major capsid protein P2, partial [Lentisphaerae bacterium]|nr:major capsid protein P2 [Lentisphaerota bacterium]